MIQSFSRFNVKRDFIDDLTYSLNNHNLDMREISRQELFRNDDNDPNNFPMICFEETEDSGISVEMSESKFLTDDMYENNWYAIYTDSNDCEYVALLNMIVSPDDVRVEVIEINKEYRSSGYGRIIVESIEDCAENNNINNILLTPFDTSAFNFWSHIGYREKIMKGVCYLSKELDNY